MENAELIKALKEDAEWAHGNEWETPLTLGNHLDTAADALEMADAKLHEQDLRIADLVAHLNAEQAKVARLVEENEELKRRLDENIRENSASHEMYMQVCEELDAAVADIADMEKSLPWGVGCYYCKHYAPAGGDGECGNCNFEWCGRKESEEIER